MSEPTEASVLHLPPDLRCASAAGAYLETLALGLGGTSDEAAGLRASAEEILGHAMRRSGAGEVEVTCRVLPHAVDLSIRDRGAPLDPGAVPGLAELHPDGLGGYLAKHGADEVHFRYLGPEGNETRLVHSLRGPLEELRPPAPEEPLPVPEDLEWTIRRMRPEDALGVCRCIHRAYGYAYPVEAVYRPEALVDLNRRGEWLTVVCVAADGRIFGTASLEGSFGPAMRETGVAAVLPEFRSRGAAGRMLTVLVDEARREGLEALSAWAVTHHPFSQRLMAGSGITPCALVLANAPAEMQTENVLHHRVQRGSVLGGYMELAGGAPEALYLPERHREFLEGLLRRMGRPPQPGAPASSGPDAAATLLEVRANRLRQGAILELQGQGADAFERLEETRQHLVDTGFVQLMLLLDLRDPRTPALCARLEDRGWFPAGMLPRTRCGEALVLQYLHALRLDYDALVVVSDEARELLSYVRSCDPHQR